jgi:hypothetical protein
MKKKLLVNVILRWLDVDQFRRTTTSTRFLSASLAHWILERIRQEVKKASFLIQVNMG